MKAIHIAEPRRLETIDISEPERPTGNQVLVKTHSMGICGTDVSSFLGKFPFFDYPRIPGHELGVEVIETGAEVENLKPGDLCSVEPYLNCGTCYPCRKGATNCCESLNVIGVMSDGGLCDRFLIPAHKLHRSDKLTTEQLALVETLAIGCHAAERAAPTESDRILIIGAGPIGLSALEFVKLSGAELSVMDREESRLEFCRKNYGIKNTIPFKGDGSEKTAIEEITKGDRYSIVIDATGNHYSMSGALSYVSQTGSLIYLGVTSENITFPHAALHRPEITIKGSRNALPSDFTRCISLIENGAIDTAPWITHRVGFNDVVNKFETFTRPESGVLKAVIQVSD
ncbi:MAG: zinc-binding alcohol dehydrogenase family protein [Verrucomicrobiales bacterium]|nr:zinc-binding alcohol dehydrogenase family protein [Verrucomicrobiales bacterium]